MTLHSISEFCPKGMQIRTPGGFDFDPATVTGIESYADAGGERLVLHSQSSVVTFTFYRNVDGGPPDVYGLAHNINIAANRAGARK